MIFIGEVAEWLKAHAWKRVNGKPFRGSNPSLSAIFLAQNGILQFYEYFDISVKKIKDYAYFKISNNFYLFKYT